MRTPEYSINPLMNDNRIVSPPTRTPSLIIARESDRGEMIKSKVPGTSRHKLDEL